MSKLRRAGDSHHFQNSGDTTTHILGLTVMQIKTASSSTSGGQAARQELGLGDDFYATSSGQRERMLQSTEKLNRTGDRIKQGRQQLLETEVSIHTCHSPSYPITALPQELTESDIFP